MADRPIDVEAMQIYREDGTRAPRRSVHPFASVLLAGILLVTAGCDRETLQECLEHASLHAQGFRNIVILNGHGPNGDPLRAAARRLFETTDARVIVMEWWAMTADLVEDIWSESGGHAGNNETAAVLAIRPDLVHRDRYTGASMATPRPNGWTAFPFPSSILLYAPGEGLPDFDADRARRYFEGTVDRLVTVIRDVIGKWERAGL